MSSKKSVKAFFAKKISNHTSKYTNYKDGQYKIILILIYAGHAAEDHNYKSDYLRPQPIIVRIIRVWPITNHKNKNAFLGTIFMCLDIQVCLRILHLKWLLLTTKHEQQMEGKVPISTSDKMYQRFEEWKIYHIRYFNFLPNNQRYKLTVHPYIININETTTITQFLHTYSIPNTKPSWSA